MAILIWKIPLSSFRNWVRAKYQESIMGRCSAGGTTLEKPNINAALPFLPGGARVITPLSARVLVPLDLRQSSRDCLCPGPHTVPQPGFQMTDTFVNSLLRTQVMQVFNADEDLIILSLFFSSVFPFPPDSSEWPRFDCMIIFTAECSRHECIVFF